MVLGKNSLSYRIDPSKRFIVGKVVVRKVIKKFSLLPVTRTTIYIKQLFDLVLLSTYYRNP